jgi:hypothetical protein
MEDLSKSLIVEQETVRANASKRTTEKRMLTFIDGKFQLKVIDIYETIEIEGVVHRLTQIEEYEVRFEPIKKSLKAGHIKLPEEIFAIFAPDFDENLWLVLQWVFQKEGKILSFAEEEESYLFPTYHKGNFKLRHKSHSKLAVRGSEMIFEQESGFGNPTHWEFRLSIDEWGIFVEFLGFSKPEDLFSAIDQGIVNWILAREFFELRSQPTIVVKPSYSTYPGSLMPAIDTTPDKSFLKPLSFSKKSFDKRSFEVTHLLVGPSAVKVWRETFIDSARMQTQMWEVHHLTDSALRVSLSQLKLAHPLDLYNWCQADEAENLPSLLEIARNTSDLCSVEFKQWENIAPEFGDDAEQEPFWMELPEFEFVLNQFGLFKFTPADYQKAVPARKLESFITSIGFGNAREVLRSISSKMRVEPEIASAFEMHSEVLYT